MTVPRTEKEIAAGVSEKAAPGDFMIITYKKAKLSIYARKLEEYGIPHQVTGGSSMNEVEQLSLLYLCLAAAAQPDNPVALVAALRSELFGISDAALYDFKAAGGKFNYRKSVPAKGIPVKDASAFESAFGMLRRYAGLIAKLPPAAAAESIAADLGLFAQAAASTGGNVQVGSMAKAIELLRAAQSEGWSISHLIEYLAEMMEMEQVYDGVPAKYGESSVVRVMNLHKAKGLEAPVVFLAGASGESRLSPRLHINRSGGGVTGFMEITGNKKEDSFAPPPVFARPDEWRTRSEEESRFEEAEKDRLMYVAATRAGSQLTIVERTGKTAHFNIWKYFKSHIEETPKLADPGPKFAPAKKKVNLSATELESARKEIIARWERALAPTYESGAAKAISIELDASPYPPDERGAEWGAVIHFLFQAAMEQPGKDLRALAVSALEEKGLDPALAGQASEIVEAVTRSEVWRRAQAGARRFVEIPFHVMLPNENSDKKIDEILVRGVIDLVFEEPGGWVIVDYKTDDKPGRDTAKLFDHYLPQLQIYAKAWKKCTGIPVKEIGLYFTHTGKYMNSDFS
jgi:ATP-dependent helicase/nuclease subunit A